MSRHILLCEKCKNFTMKEDCDCGGKGITVQPPKYSPEDKYGSYRRKAKREFYENKGLL